MLDGQWGSDAEGAYTVISRPPYWTALALFPEGSTWGGGGVFLDDRHYLAAGDADIIGRDDGLVRLHWGDTGRGCTTGLRRPDNSPAPLDKTTVTRLLSGDLPADHRDLDGRLWNPSDRPLDRYDTQGGCLYRRAGGEMELIRDFTRMTFEPIRAPYDWRDETGARSGSPVAPSGWRRRMIPRQRSRRNPCASKPHDMRMEYTWSVRALHIGSIRPVTAPATGPRIRVPADARNSDEPR